MPLSIRKLGEHSPLSLVDTQMHFLYIGPVHPRIREGGDEEQRGIRDEGRGRSIKPSDGLANLGGEWER